MSNPPATFEFMTHPEPAGNIEAPRPAPRSLARQVAADTFRGWGARLGAVWIAFIALLAVFAPVIASSHPIVLKTGGHWSSPLLKFLTPADGILILFTLAAALLGMARRLTFGQKTLILAWLLSLLIPFCSWAVIRQNWTPWRQAMGPALLWILCTFVAAADLAVFAGASRALGFSVRQWVWVAAPMAAVALVLLIWPIRPPETVVYEHYRNLARQGQIEFAVYAPVRYSASDRQRDVRDSALQPPSREHWFGTEANGADVLARMIHACRIATSIGLIATGIAILIGITVGGVMGYFVGKVDIIGMRLVEIFEAIPTLFLLIAFVAFFGRNLYLIMAIIGLTSWTGDARFIRAEFLRLRDQDFVQAAIAAGLPLRSILFRHMLPNGIAPVLVSASFGVASAILSESILSFLGIGLVDEPSWGQMLNQATGVVGTFVWWMAIFPGLAIFLTVFSYNLIGEALRDALDPKLRGSQ